METCCDNITKSILFLFNFIFFLVGLALSFLGAFLINFSDEFIILSAGEKSLNVGLIALMTIGGLVVAVSFFGCCGACTENSCMLSTYAFLLSAVVIAQIGITIAVYVYKADAKKLVTKSMKKSMNEYNGKNTTSSSKDKSEVYTRAWNHLQIDLSCCGIDGSKDWLNTTYGKIPQSCCKSDRKSKTCTDEPDNIFKQGCLTTALEFVNDHAGLLGGVAIGCIVVEIIGIIVACCLSRNIRKQKYEYC